jgi:hypothetical protein
MAQLSPGPLEGENIYNKMHIAIDLKTEGA